MARLRISGPARADLAAILATSEGRWGAAGRARYARVFATALQAVAAQPDGPLTRDRHELRAGVRSFHLRHTKASERVRAPVHVIYFRVASREVVEIIRVLHERMDPGLHVVSPPRR